MVGFEQKDEAPKNPALSPMADVMPKPGRNKKEINEADIAKFSKGYNKANPQNKENKEMFNLLKKEAEDYAKKENETWIPGTVLERIDWKSSGQDEMKGYEFILVTGNKEGELHFFKSPTQQTKSMKDVSKESNNNKSRIDLSEYADNNLGKPVVEMKDGPLLKKLTTNSDILAALSNAKTDGHPKNVLYTGGELADAGIIKKNEIPPATGVFFIQDTATKKIQIFTGKMLN